MRRYILAAAIWLLGVAAYAQVGQIVSWPPKKPVTGGTGISLVGSQLAWHQNPGSGLTTAATLTGTTAGNLIVVGSLWCDSVSCSFNTANGISSITSSAGETCALATGAQNNNSGSISTAVGYCKNIVGGTDTITITYAQNTTNYGSVLLSEWANANTTSPDDGIGNINAVAGATSLSVATNGSTTTSGELIYSVAASDNALTPGQTVLNVVASTNKDEYQISTTTGVYTDTWTQSPSGKIIGSVAAFKP